MSKVNNLTEQLKEKITSLSYRGRVDKYEVARICNFSMQTAERRIKSLKLIHTKSSLISLLQKYDSGMTAAELSKRNGVSVASINGFLVRCGVPRKGKQHIYNSDFNYFDIIDDEYKAYILGFIYADGCLHKNTLKISLATKDKNILEKIKKAMFSENPIKITHYETTFGSFSQCNLSINSRQIKKSLNTQGVTERKTETTEFPDIALPLIKHFIRGYVDGDGSFGRYLVNCKTQGKHHKYNLSICGTPKFLQKIQLVFKDVAKVGGCYCKRRKKSLSVVTSLRYSGGRSVKKILNYLYKDAQIYLDRKYKNYLQICA